ncbi:sulfotransferase [Roseibacillus persicicus]|uniref:sulfotransferase n=1 Tax=Roseibacillus persicicus TaxID=454148 RepID=UPI00280FC9EA|nr:sulfotransferase [Roseibacillus persicicus]MDQ8188861.1 sulfotransferase [Roseibacillus persicicus]
MKPNLFLLGAQKCATTSLAATLASTGQISFGRLKEPFILCYDDVSVLGDCFESEESLARSSKFDGSQVQFGRLYSALYEGVNRVFHFGDASTLYLPSETAAKRIKEFYPDSKFVVVLRDPVKRSLSAFSHYQQRMFPNGSLDDLVLSDDKFGVLRFSRYFEQVRFWLDLFPRESFFITTFEELLSDSGCVFSALSEFLAIDLEVSQIEKENPGLGRVTQSRLLSKFVQISNQVGLRTYPKQYVPASLEERLRSMTLPDGGINSRRKKRLFVEKALLKGGCFRAIGGTAFERISAELKELFEDEYQKLPQLLPEVDFSRWNH